MISTLAIFLAFGVITSTNTSCSYPTWPQDFKWSGKGPIDGIVCTKIHEPKDPNT